MRQPELGRKLGELRHEKGYTQKELSDQCGIDIRTIQRIEGGEVLPRISTLKLISETLKFDVNILKGNHSLKNKDQHRQTLLYAMIMGIICLINGFFYLPLLPVYPLVSNPGWIIITSIIHMVSSVSLYYGIYTIGDLYRNKTMQFTSVVIMIIVPFMVLSQLVTMATSFYVSNNLTMLFGVILGINGIALGISLLLNNGDYILLYKITGILQILVSPMFIIQVSIIPLIGLWLSIPFTILLIVMLSLEYLRIGKSQNTDWIGL